MECPPARFNIASAGISGGERNPVLNRGELKWKIIAICNNRCVRLWMMKNNGEE